MKAFQKSIDNVRITCPMIYHTQEKSSEPFQAYSEATFDYSTTENIQTITDYIAECISIRKKILKQFPSRWKHIERLLSIIAFREWTENVPKICRKIYQAQEKFQKIISSHVEANLETTLDYCSPEIARKCAEDMSDDIPDTGKISKKLFRAVWSILRDYFRL